MAGEPTAEAVSERDLQDAGSLPRSLAGALYLNELTGKRLDLRLRELREALELR